MSFYDRSCPDPAGAVPKTVIFDCDGVLIDSWNAHLVFFNRVKAAVGLPPMTAEEEAYVFVATTSEALERIIPADLLEQARREKASIPAGDIIPHVTPQPGISELLAALKERGVGIAVNTNSGREVRHTFDALGFSPYFDVVMTADDVIRPKPHPEGAFRALAELHTDPCDAVFIGDSHIDEQTAFAAGIPFWAYRNPELTAVRHVSDFFALIPELARP